MGGPQAPNYNRNTGEVMQNYMQYLPSLSQATAGAQPGIDMTLANSAAATAPVYNQATMDMYAKYAPLLAGVGQQVGKSNALAATDTNAAVLGSPAASSATASANSLEQQANPEFYKTRATASGKLNDLMNSINLNGLSGSERAEVERSLGQSQTATGNLGLDNATNAVGNAMTFGSALQGKRDAMASAINTATNYLPQSKSSFDPVALALGNPSTTASTGNAVGQFAGVTPSGSQAFGMGNNMLGGLMQNNASNQALQYQSAQARSGQGVYGSVMGGIGQTICCFIFLETYNGALPWWIRRCRDRYYQRFPQIATGYRRMARWLVPSMRRSRLVRWMVWRWMVSPLTLYGGFLMHVQGYEDCKQFKGYRKFWFTVWQLMGR